MKIQNEQNIKYESEKRKEIARLLTEKFNSSLLQL